ncbi:MAG: molecular chaperone HtpG, partial [Lachnospiraceae bacterium]
EIISNGCDAITKLKKLEGIGEYSAPEGNRYNIQVIVNPDEKTLKFIDNGIGMTAEEVEQYITQIAFSGASKFLEQYENVADGDQIIGHFGLGFYSAFMVADEVHIDTLSYKEGSSPVHWESDGESEYTIEEGDRTERGTEITLFLNDECYEFCNEYRVRTVIEKYCSFVPVEIYLSDEVKEASNAKEEVNEDADKDVKEAEKHPINDTHPLWTKMPSECTDEDYKAFYRKVFHDYKEPLFWIHLNMDYPLSLKGIVYFPKLNTQYDSLEAEIKLYNNQVFIADNIKEVVPEFLMALKGVIDCPDLPLNVSRSALQNDGSVRKISDYISRKFADKLVSLCKNERESYEKNWNDISPFIKFGCLKDDKFADKMLNNMLFEDLDGKFLTLPEYKEKNNLAAEAGNAEENSEETPSDASETADSPKEEKAEEKSTVYYVSDKVQQAQFINMFKKRDKDAVILNNPIDTQFITKLEEVNKDLRFFRVDAVIDDDLTNKKQVKKEDVETLTEMFRKALKKKELAVEAKNMKDKSVAAVLTLSEDSRRMADLIKMYNLDGMPDFAEKEVLVLNGGNKLVKYLLANKDSENASIICKQLYDLAVLSHRSLTQDEMAEFLKRSNEILMLVAGE